MRPKRGQGHGRWGAQQSPLAFHLPYPPSNMSQLQGARDLTFNQSTLIAIAGDNTVNNIHGPDGEIELFDGSHITY